jgi:hypothetical protein
MKPTHLLPASVLASIALTLTGYAQGGSSAGATQPAAGNSAPAPNSPAASPAPPTKSDRAPAGQDRASSDQERAAPAKASPVPDNKTAATASDAATTPPASQPAAEAPKSEEALSPTGKSSGATTPNANPNALSAGKAVRIALDLNTNLAKADLQVEPEGDHVVLQGRVSDDQVKKRAFETAYAASGSVKVVDKITVQK